MENIILRGIFSSLIKLLSCDFSHFSLYLEIRFFRVLVPKIDKMNFSGHYELTNGIFEVKTEFNGEKWYDQYFK